MQHRGPHLVHWLAGEPQHARRPQLSAAHQGMPQLSLMHRSVLPLDVITGNGESAQAGASTRTRPFPSMRVGPAFTYPPRPCKLALPQPPAPPPPDAQPGADAGGGRWRLLARPSEPSLAPGIAATASARVRMRAQALHRPQQQRELANPRATVPPRSAHPPAAGRRAAAASTGLGPRPPAVLAGAGAACSAHPSGRALPSSP